MFAEHIFKLSSADYDSHILLIDADKLEEATHFSEYFGKQCFQVIRYIDDLQFRVQFSDALKDSGRYLIIAHPEDYIPYDIFKRFRCTDISLANLFPKLNIAALKEEKELNYDLLTMAYKNNLNP